MRAAVREVRGARSRRSSSRTGSATRRASATKVPTVIFGPGGPPVYCPDEHLTVADIHEATKVYAVFAALALTCAEGA